MIPKTISRNQVRQDIYNKVEELWNQIRVDNGAWLRKNHRLVDGTNGPNQYLFENRFAPDEDSDNDGSSNNCALFSDGSIVDFRESHALLLLSVTFKGKLIRCDTGRSIGDLTIFNSQNFTRILEDNFVIINFGSEPRRGQTIGKVIGNNFIPVKQYNSREVRAAPNPEKLLLIKENRDLEPEIPEDQIWARLNVYFNIRNQESLGEVGNRRWDTKGVIALEVFVPQNCGVGQLDEIAQTLEDGLLGQRIGTTNKVIIGSAIARDTGAENLGSHYRTIISAYFEYQEVKQIH